jgi:uncharacterized protein YndB with AHSA1/START domain
VSAERISTTRRIAAPPAAIFAIVADPSRHVAIDGSGMVEGAIDPRPLTAVGETFDMDMDRTPLNDIPGLVKYQVRNVVTRIEPDRLVEWTTGGVDLPPVGHVYGWQLEPAGDGETEVTHYCDWSGISDEMRTKRSWPIVPLAMLEASVENLDRIATA